MISLLPIQNTSLYKTEYQASLNTQHYNANQNGDWSQGLLVTELDVFQEKLTYIFDNAGDEEIDLYNKKIDRIVTFFRKSKKFDSKVRYTIGFYSLLYLGTKTPELEMWSEGFSLLENASLSSREFTKGFIELMQAGVSTKELNSYASLCWFLIDTIGKSTDIDLEEEVNNIVNIIKDKNLSEDLKKELLDTKHDELCSKGLRKEWKTIFKYGFYIAKVLFGIV